MNLPLWKKYVGESRLLWLACAVTMFGFCWLRVWIVSLFPMGRFKNVVEQFKEFERFLPVPFEQLFTYSGRIALTYDELIVIVCICVWSIARGSDCVSGELGRGTMELLLAQPISRLRLMLTQAAVTIGGLAALAALSWLGIYVGIQTTQVEETLPMMGPSLLPLLADAGTYTVPMSQLADSKVFLPAALNLFSLGFLLAALSTLMSSWDRYRWRTIGIVVGIYIVQLILKIAALATERLAWMMKLTFFAAYEPEHLVSVAVNTPADTWSFVQWDAAGHWQAWGPSSYCLLLLTLGVACYLGACWVFTHRDLPAPL